MEPFKNMMNPEVVRALGDAVLAHSRAFEPAAFDRDAFVAEALDGLDALELKERVDQITRALHRNLHLPFEEAARCLVATLPPALEGAEGVTAGFSLWPLCHFVEVFGVEHLDASMAAMYELTQRFSAEFAVRPFLARYPEATLARLLALTGDPNEHVRRWCSEGTRPRLPWGMRLAAFVADPRPVLPILEALRDDESEYVRRSVANNLNDIAKDNPDLVLDLCERWLADASAERAALVRHALRTLVKAGDARALALLGYGGAAISVEGFTVDPVRAAVGEVVTLALRLSSSGDAEQALLIDYIVHHQRANGGTSPKVFKWTTRAVAPGGTLALSKRHSFKPVTTRRYYAGVHRIEVQVNGAVVASASVELET